MFYTCFHVSNMEIEMIGEGGAGPEPEYFLSVFQTILLLVISYSFIEIEITKKYFTYRVYFLFFFLPHRILLKFDNHNFHTLLHLKISKTLTKFDGV